jgi:hypothetical protein
MAKRRILTAFFALWPLAASPQDLRPVQGDTASRRAAITGGGGPGRCTLEVNVDHAAQIEISGDTGNLRTLAGQPSFWRRFECNVPLPRTPHDFQIARVNGRGSVRLLKDPSSNHGTAVVHILDPKGGRGVYTVDLAWRGPGGGWGPGPGQGPRGNQFAVQRCQEAVSDRLNRDGYQVASFGRIDPDNNAGPGGRIHGVVTGKRGAQRSRFSFSCSVDPRSGAVRSLDVRRHEPDWKYQ